MASHATSINLNASPSFLPLFDLERIAASGYLFCRLFCCLQLFEVLHCEQRRSALVPRRGTSLCLTSDAEKTLVLVSATRPAHSPHTLRSQCSHMVLGCDVRE